jgi:hypothetical protein
LGAAGQVVMMLLAMASGVNAIGIIAHAIAPGPLDTVTEMLTTNNLSKIAKLMAILVSYPLFFKFFLSDVVLLIHSLLHN